MTTTQQSAAPTFNDVWRMFQETNLKFQETDRLLKEIGKRLGALGNRLGEFVQEMVRPALIRLLRERGLPVHQVGSI